MIKQVRIAWYAVLDGGVGAGTTLIAVPIRTAAGRTAAAMNIGVHATRVPLEDMERKFLLIPRGHAQIVGRFVA